MQGWETKLLEAESEMENGQSKFLCGFLVKHLVELQMRLYYIDTTVTELFKKLENRE